MRSVAALLIAACALLAGPGVARPQVSETDPIPRCSDVGSPYDCVSSSGAINGHPATPEELAHGETREQWCIALSRAIRHYRFERSHQGGFLSANEQHDLAGAEANYQSQSCQNVPGAGLG